MSWHHQNALKRVFNVFKRSKERKLPIYDNDIETLKLLSTVNESKSEAYVNDNLLFGKLVLYFLKPLLSFIKVFFKYASYNKVQCVILKTKIC